MPNVTLLISSVGLKGREAGVIPLRHAAHVVLQSKLVQTVSLLTCTGKVPARNPGVETDQTEVFRDFARSLEASDANGLRLLPSTSFTSLFVHLRTTQYLSYCLRVCVNH